MTMAGFSAGLLRNQLASLGWNRETSMSWRQICRAESLLRTSESGQSRRNSNLAAPPNQHQLTIQCQLFSINFPHARIARLLTLITDVNLLGLTSFSAAETQQATWPQASTRAPLGITTNSIVLSFL